MDRQDLIDAYLDGKASPEMLAELDRALAEDEELRLQFLQSADLISDLSKTLCGAEPIPMPKPPRPRTTPLQLLTLAAGFVMAVGLFFSMRPTPPPNLLTVVQGAGVFGSTTLKRGDRFEPLGQLTSGASELICRYPDGTDITLEPDSVLQLKTGATKKFTLTKGAVIAEVEPQPQGREMAITTAHSVVRVLGTRFRLSTGVFEDLLAVDHGEVEFFDKKLNVSRVVGPRAEPHRVEGMQIQWASPYRSRPFVNFDDLSDSYKPKRWWLTDDFEPRWLNKLWEVSPPHTMEYQSLEAPLPNFVLEQAERNGDQTNVLKVTHPNGSGPPVSLRMKRRILWHSFFLNYQYYPLSDDVDFRQICLDFPDGVEMETIFESRENLEKADSWNEVRVEYLEYLKGTSWAFEVRRHVNGEHQSTTRVKTGKMEPIIFELRSGAVLLDQISIGELAPVAPVNG